MLVIHVTSTVFCIIEDKIAIDSDRRMIHLKNKSQTYSIDIYIQYSTVDIFSFHDLLKDIFFSLAYFIVRI